MQSRGYFPRSASGGRGVLFKGGVHLERTATVKVVALDKTGTLTEGKPRVTDVIVDGRIVNFRGDGDASALGLLKLAASVEEKSEHPLAQAIVAEARRRGLPDAECAGFQSISGKGASRLVGGWRSATHAILGRRTSRFRRTLRGQSPSYRTGPQIAPIDTD